MLRGILCISAFRRQGCRITSAALNLLPLLMKFLPVNYNPDLLMLLIRRILYFSEFYGSIELQITRAHKRGSAQVTTNKSKGV